MKRCPYCGATPEMKSENTWLQGKYKTLVHYVICPKRCCMAPIHFSVKEAAEAWDKQYDYDKE